jgi:pyruvate oxidase
VAKTVAEVLWDTLVEHGVEFVFGIPGDSIDPLLDSLRRDRRIRFIQVRHEEAGAFMASAYAKKTGRLGVCMGTAGPGAIHLLNGLYDAKMDHAPVLALTGQVGLPYIGSDYFQEVDLIHLFEDVALYDYQVADASQIALMAGQACRTAIAKRGVAHLSFPFEVSMQKVHGTQIRYPVVRRQTDSVPTEELLVEAVRRIERAERPVILAGKGARACRNALLAFAERGSIPVVNTLPGKGVIPDEHPLSLGGLGLLGAKPAHTAMERTDLCIMVGTSYPYLEFLPKAAQMIQIDWEASQVGKRYPVDIGLVGSAEPTLRLLTKAMHPRPQDAWADHLHAERLHWFEEIDKQAEARVHQGRGVHPQWVADRLSHLVDADANIAIDVGNSLVWMARNFRIRDHGWLVSSWLGSMGFGMPAAIAAKLAEPDRQSIAAVGDGGFAMLMADFVTAVKYQLPIVVVVFNNQRLGMIKFEQEVHGMPEFGTDLWNPDFSQFAEGAGGKGIRVDRAEDVETAIGRALSWEVPTVVDIATDPDEKPLPPRITLGEAKGYAEALFRETFGR